jgi:mannose-6-phosphate isomerase
MTKVWGGDRLGGFGKVVKAGERVGESWEVADLATTSASGAGGEGVCSRIANGALRGQTLRDAMRAWGEQFVHRDALTAEGAFPLLIKFLDAREHLSVQVHPSPAYARRQKGAHLKTECWYILAAQPGSVIYKGVRAGVTRERFEATLREGDGAGVVALLEAVPAVVGEMHNLPSGTVHALGAGVLVAEVQTPSDTTYRVYDWGRKGRELHIQQAMACIEFGPAPAAIAMHGGDVSPALDTEFFRVERHTLRGPAPLGVHRGQVCIVVEGSGRISSEGTAEGGRAFEAIDVRAGTTYFVPAGLVGGATLTPRAVGEASLSCLWVSIPLTRWRAMGGTGH